MLPLVKRLLALHFLGVGFAHLLGDPMRLFVIIKQMDNCVATDLFSSRTSGGV